MDSIINILAIATLAAQIFVAVSLISWLFDIKSEMISHFVRQRRLMLALLTALAATLGSLYFSGIAGLDPCKLCWFQRIFMYPQAVILAIAFWKRDEFVEKYILTLSGIGILFSAYHIYIQQFNVPTMCSVSGPSCEVPDFVQYGYISPPVMALTAFAILITLFAVYREKRS